MLYNVIIGVYPRHMLFNKVVIMTTRLLKGEYICCKKKIERIKLEFPDLYTYLEGELTDLVSEPTDDKIPAYNAFTAFYFGMQVGSTHSEFQQKQIIELLNELLIQE